MPDGGRLTIETASVELDEDYVASRGEGTPGHNALLAVSDTGVGMSEEVSRHLFEPFFTTKAPGSGTGLGLATVFGVVKQSGGSIYVYSEEGRGTTLKIYLPAATGAAEAAAGAGEGPEERGTETIVLVENDESVRNLVRVMLESKGYDVLAAAGAEEAERLCAERPAGVDLLLSDVVMPGVNGRVLAERLAAMTPSPRVLFMSGYPDEAVYRHGEIRPDASFIEKPFTDRTLARKVREVLDPSYRYLDGVGEAAADLELTARLGVGLDAVPRGVCVWMVEDVEGLLAVANLDREPITGLVVRDGHQHRVVVLAPEQPHVDHVARAVI
jgi:FixJ family two-component response regulator